MANFFKRHWGKIVLIILASIWFGYSKKDKIQEQVDKMKSKTDGTA